MENIVAQFAAMASTTSLAVCVLVLFVCLGVFVSSSACVLSLFSPNSRRPIEERFPQTWIDISLCLSTLRIYFKFYLETPTNLDVSLRTNSTCILQIASRNSRSDSSSPPSLWERPHSLAQYSVLSSSLSHSSSPFSVNSIAWLHLFSPLESSLFRALLP